ncbi:TetR/AcrR family transcriptional regulator [Glycomyces sp. NPDC047010]|uniref:TetR/AcrR family transcriptional regulator n=1 Tax=Glycomyces sp. NPDC047010 TaxID=3155023 RepID=UPI003400FFC9
MPRDTGGTARTIELLWGVGSPRGARGPRPGLSVPGITRAALAIADAEGLGAVSMQRVAKDLGYTTMSLYNYIPSKDQLIELMIDAATPEPPAPEEGDGWREGVEQWVRATWDLYRAHKWILKAPVNAPLGPNQMAWFESLLQSLSRGGLVGGEVMAVAQHLLASTRGQAAIAADLATGETGLSTETNDALRRLATPDRFPILHGLLPTDPPPGGFDPEEEMFAGLQLGLRLLLDGMERHLQRKSG